MLLDDGIEDCAVVGVGLEEVLVGGAVNWVTEMCRGEVDFVDSLERLTRFDD